MSIQDTVLLKHKRTREYMSRFSPIGDIITVTPYQTARWFKNRAEAEQIAEKHQQFEVISLEKVRESVV